MPAASPPRWARVVDLICLALVLLALIIWWFGGFRMRVAGVRIALTSPFRTLAWAVALALVRQLLSPAIPIYRDAPPRLLALMRTEAARSAAIVLIATRLSVLTVGCFGLFAIGYREGGAPWKLIETNEFVNLQARWDTGWYLGIATDGYTYDPNLSPDKQQNIVFFPAFPLLMRVAGRLLGGSSPAFLLGGTLVALAAFFGALVYLYRLARELLDEDATAWWALWMLAAFPFAVFFSAVYTESVFLLGAVGAFYHFRRGEFVRAGVWGLLVGLSRPPGCLVSVPLAVLAISPWLPAWLAGGPRPIERARADFRSLGASIAAAAMPGVGMLLYSAYVWRLTGHPLAWLEGHAAWGREYNGLGVLVTTRYEWLSQGGVYAYASQFPIDILNVLATVFILATVWPVARRLGLAYAVFILINIIPPLMAGGFLSAGRFASVLFPGFVWFANAVPERHRFAWVAIFMAVQALNSILFYTWRPLY